MRECRWVFFLEGVNTLSIECESKEFVHKRVRIVRDFSFCCLLAFSFSDFNDKNCSFQGSDKMFYSEILNHNEKYMFIQNSICAGGNQRKGPGKGSKKKVRERVCGGLGEGSRGSGGRVWERVQGAGSSG